MKLIPVTLVLIFMVTVIVAKSDDDSPDSHDLHIEEDKSNISLPSFHGTVTSKARKFVVSLEKPTETSQNSPKRRNQRRNPIPKFEIQHNASTENTTTLPATRRPHLMHTKRFTSKPHAIDHVEKLMERSNFHKRRIQNKFNELGSEEKRKITEKRVNKTRKTVKFQHHIQNFTDIDIANDHDSEESKETKRHLRRRQMKTAASNKVKTIVPPPFTNSNTQRNYRIKDLLKNQKYIPKADRKMVPVLALQRGNGAMTGGKTDTTASKNAEESSTKKNVMSPEESADQHEFIFIKENKQSSTTPSPDDEIVTADPVIELLRD